MKELFLAILLMAAFSTTSLAECSEADKNTLKALDAAWSVAGLNGDRAALMAIYADDYVGLPGMLGKARTIEDTMQTFERNKANPSGEKVTYDHYLISCTPTTATVTHRNTIITMGPDGKERVAYTRSVHILEKRNGRWQVVSNAGNALDDNAILWYLEQDWNNALMKRDRAWFDKYYASDFTGVSSMTGNLANKAQEISDIVNDRGLELAETSDMSIRVDGNMAVVTGIFRTKGKDEKGAPYDRRVRYIDTWVKRDGRWQAWTSQGTIIPEAKITARN